MTFSEPPSTETAATDNELDLRRALTGLHELLVMSMLMLDRHDVDEVIEVLATAVESVTGCQLVHVTFQRHHEWTTWPPGHPTTSSLRPGETRVHRESRRPLDVYDRRRGVVRLTGSAGPETRH